MPQSRLLSALFALALALPSCQSRAEGRIVTEFGTQAGAAYRIDIPANWNHELVVYYHGYSIEPIRFGNAEALSPMFAPLLAKGYALIQSGYSRAGWAIEQAFPETEKLRQTFVARHGAPKRNYVMGMSMGGALTALTIESRPDVYAGALSLCGAIEPSNRGLQRDFALLAAFDHYFPGILGPLAPVRADYQADAVNGRRIAEALASNPVATRSLLGIYGTADAHSIGDVITFATYIVKELQQRAHGNPFGNADVIYVGSQDDGELNDNVQRYRADPAAAAYVSRWYTPSGKLARPMLALHDTGDPLVPAAAAFEYALAAQRAGHADLFVQQYVHREGHCVFTPDEIAHAFDELVGWVNTGERPASGKLPAR